MMGEREGANGAGAKADAAVVKTSIGPTCLVGKSATSVQRRDYSKSCRNGFVAWSQQNHSDESEGSPRARPSRQIRVVSVKTHYESENRPARRMKRKEACRPPMMRPSS